MIERYSRQAIQKIWSDHTKFQKWLDVELAACYAHHQLGAISSKDYKTITQKACFQVPRILEIENEVHHDVIAFLTNLAEHIGPASRYVHLGLTSSDVVDTAFSLQIQDAGKILLADIRLFLKVLKKQAFAYQLTPMMGRTHGVHAEPLTLGLKLTLWYSEMTRHEKRLLDALEMLRVGKISGAVGNYAHLSPEIEKVVCKKLGLAVSPVSSQILQRDRHAQFMTTLALIGGSLEKIATEIRALQKTEFNELQEPFSKKQKGSSAMPHKRNPIICERVSGLARVIRGYALTAMENQALWHERDISHSSTERVIFPDSTILLDYMFAKLTDVIEGMTVNEAQMKENIGRSYHVFYSQQLLLKLVEKGMLREEAYRLVQENALYAFDHQVTFDSVILKDKRISGVLSKKELAELFDFSQYTRHIETIYSRVF